jgi:DNA primase
VDLLIEDRIQRAGGSLGFLNQRVDAARAAAAIIAQLPVDQIGDRAAELAQRLDLPLPVITSALVNAVSPASDDFPSGPLHGPATCLPESQPPQQRTTRSRTR